MSYHLFIVACAGAGATVIALVSNYPRTTLVEHSTPSLQTRFPFQLLPGEAAKDLCVQLWLTVPSVNLPNV